MFMKRFFTKLLEQFKKNNNRSVSVRNSNVDNFISGIKDEIGFEINNTEKIGGRVCISSDLCMIYYRKNDIRIAFDIRAMPEQASMILSGIHKVVGIDNVKVLESYYYQSNREDSLLVGQDALYKYIEDVSSNIAHYVAQDEMNKLAILEQYESDTMQ